jgi:uroporphyrinogen decarboxylase
MREHERLLVNEESEGSASFKGLRMAALESRRGQDMHRLIERFGGTPFVSASMREVPVESNREAIDFAYRIMTGEIGVVIFTTGVGFRQLLVAIEKHVDTKRFLDALSDITTIVRGPKPLAAMREVGLQPTIRVPEPNTWRELLQAVDQQLSLNAVTVGLQEYGVTNHSLVAGLEARGASVVNVRVYQWDLPVDVKPLEDNIQEMIAGNRDGLLVTSAHQVVNLLRLAREIGVEEKLRSALDRIGIFSIGPTTTEMLRHLELAVDFEPEHPKMGHLVSGAAANAQRIIFMKRQWSGGTPTESQPILNALTPSQQSDSDPVHDSPFMRALRREKSAVTPIWLMRQAGRYMPEYRAVRDKVGFLELCKRPDLCAEVMVTAVDRLGVDAAIIFSDLLPILEPMGMQLEFTVGDGPQIHNPIRQPSDIDRVNAISNMDSLHFVVDTVRQTRAALPANIPVIGFAGAPFTLASYMIEGGGSKNYVHTKYLMFNDPPAFHVLMQKLVDSLVVYLNAQVDAGAQCLQIFDSWAGCLSPSDYQAHVLPHMQRLLANINPLVPVINFATGNPLLLPLLRGDARTTVGVDWRIELDRAWEMIGYDRAVQGNLDPTILFADQAKIREAAQAVLDYADNRPGHIFNLGHGILPNTPVDNVIALVDAVHEISSR